MVIIRGGKKAPQRLQVIWNYFWNQHGCTQGKSQNEEEEGGRDAAACGRWKYTWTWSVHLLQLKPVYNPPPVCYCITIGDTWKCVFAIWIFNVSASDTCKQLLKKEKKTTVPKAGTTAVSITTPQTPARRDAWPLCLPVQVSKLCMQMEVHAVSHFMG